MNDKKQVKCRVIAKLNREGMEYLDKLSMDALFSTGSKLTRIDIIEALVEAAKQLGITGEHIKNKEELIARILAARKQQTERRKYPRLNKDLIARFREAESDSEFKHSNTDNISWGGFKVEVSEIDSFLHLHQLIEIEIQDMKGQEPPAKAFGQIVWMKKSEIGPGYEMGVQMTYVPEKDKEKFLRFLNEKGKTEKRK